ncbi:MAG: hypothetical protein ACI4IT_04470 [Oscillospiraceae bacterium]
MEFQKIVTGFLLSISFICGIIMLFFGINETAELGIRTKGYDETEGHLSDYTVYSADDDGTTYRLVYTYTVSGTEYTVSTDYGTGTLPPMNTAHKIMYDPDDPAKAVIVGGSSNAMLMFGGVIFTAVPVVIFLGILVITGRLDISGFDFLGFIIGIVLIAVSYIVIYIISGSLSLVKAFEHMGFLTAIPAMLIAAGAFLIIKTVFLGIRKKK